MARLPRIDLPGFAQHVIARGNDRQRIFRDTADLLRYRELLLRALIACQCELHAYVFMGNHVHLLLTPRTHGALSRCMQDIGRNYVQYVNRTYQRTGTLFEGRFRSTVIETEHYLLACYRYIELNPVRAGLVAAPADYPWSSYSCNALGTVDELVTPHPAYLGISEYADTRTRAYRDLFAEPATLVEEQGSIRSATNKGWGLGSERFRDEVEKRSSRRCHPNPRGGDRRSETFRQQQGINRN